MCRRARNSSHNVYSELQPQRVYILCQNTEPLPAGRGREPDRVRKQARILVHHKFPKRNVLVLVTLRTGVNSVPLNVDHHIFPSEFFQVRRHVLGVRADLRFIHLRIVVIIAVPSHRRIWCKIILVHISPPFSYFYTAHIGSHSCCADPACKRHPDREYLRKQTPC